MRQAYKQLGILIVSAYALGLTNAQTPKSALVLSGAPIVAWHIRLSDAPDLRRYSNVSLCVFWLCGSGQ